MMQVGDMVVYKCRGMYEVEEIGTLNFSGADRKKLYYSMQSVDDAKEKVYIPVEGEHNIRKPVSREEALALIDEMDDIELLWVANERMREREYKNCIAGCRCEEWVKILKTLYQRGNKRGSITSMDRKYRQIAEKALHSELSYALDIPVDKVEEFIVNRKGVYNSEEEVV